MTAQSAGLVAWQDRARDMLHRLNTMQPPNVVLQQITMLGEARSIIEAALAAPAADGVLVPREALQFWADILADGRTKTDSGLDVTVLELIDVNQACAQEMRKYLPAAPQAQGDGK